MSNLGHKKIINLHCQKMNARKWFDDRTKPDNLKVISAAEGFFKIEGNECRFPYMW